mmetsp:Transcript_34851/g.86480  ORF Transcript_34851/g.86480 Transcript_34851/m.86480 type:complete len:220 (+) Transcript_34851:666-1325(+)
MGLLLCAVGVALPRKTPTPNRTIPSLALGPARDEDPHPRDEVADRHKVAHGDVAVGGALELLDDVLRTNPQFDVSADVGFGLSENVAVAQPQLHRLVAVLGQRPLLQHHTTVNLDDGDVVPLPPFVPQVHAAHLVAQHAAPSTIPVGLDGLQLLTHILIHLVVGYFGDRVESPVHEQIMQPVLPLGRVEAAPTRAAIRATWRQRCAAPRVSQPADGNCG